MDIKAKINELVEKIKGDKNLLAKFKADPIKTIESIIGIDLPDETIEKIIDGVKAKIALDKLDDIKDDLGGALAVYSYEADVVGLVLSATDDFCVFPPACAPIANRPVIGIVTKCDEPNARPDLAEMRLELCGCERIFHTSSYSNDGIDELLDYLR